MTFEILMLPGERQFANLFDIKAPALNIEISDEELKKILKLRWKALSMKIIILIPNEEESKNEKGWQSPIKVFN